jgi:ribonucleoside-diphosphate reductase alpha chain
MYFIDRANYYSNSHYFSYLPCTNPCGEQPLPAWGVCNLGHVNLSKHMNAADNDVDWENLKKTVQYAVRFQDNVIDATPYFFDENKNQQMSERRVGMGTIGLAEMLIKLKIKYGSPDSEKFIDKLYQFISVTAYETSVALAQEKGAFSQFNAEKFLQIGFMQAMPEYIRKLVREKGIRNVTILTQAPTGTVGTMVGTSTGIEPFYSWTYFRKARLGVHEEKIKIAQDFLDANPGEDLPDYFANAMDLTPEEHVRVQAAVQRWTDSAISKTVNAPADYTIDQTKKLYELMYDLGCKGGTIYRDSSRQEQILATDMKNLGKDVVEQMAAKAKKSEALVEAAHAAAVANVAVAGSIVEAAALSEKTEKEIMHIDAHDPSKIVVKKLLQNGIRYEIVPRERPHAMHGTTYKMNTPYGNLFVTINEDEHGPFEVFAQLGKAGGFFSAQSEAICRLISLGLRSGVSVQEIVKQIKGIRSTEVAFSNGEVVYSLPDAIGKVLEKHILKNQQSLQLQFKEQQTQKLQMEITEEVKETVKVNNSSMTVESKVSLANLGFAPACPNCSSMLIMQEGCMKCGECGYSKCG